MAGNGPKIGTGTLVILAIAALLVFKPGGSAPSPTPAPNAHFGTPFSVNGWSVDLWQLGKLEDLMPGEQSLVGEQMWLLDVEMTNLTGNQAEVGTGFTLQDADGVIESANPLAPVSPPLTGTLAPGGHLRGYLGFELTAGVPPVAVIVRPGDLGGIVNVSVPTPTAFPVAVTPTASPGTTALVSPSAAALSTPSQTPAPTPRPTPKPTPTLAPTLAAWLKQYCKEVQVNLMVASGYIGDIYSSGSTGFIVWDTVELKGNLAAIAGNDSLAGAQPLPRWPPAKKANTLLVTAARAYVSTGSAFERAGSDHSSSEYTDALLGDTTIDAYHNADVEVNRLMSAYGLGCY